MARFAGTVMVDSPARDIEMGFGAERYDGMPRTQSTVMIDCLSHDAAIILASVGLASPSTFERKCFHEDEKYEIDVLVKKTVLWQRARSAALKWCMDGPKHHLKIGGYFWKKCFVAAFPYLSQVCAYNAPVLDRLIKCDPASTCNGCLLW